MSWWNWYQAQRLFDRSRGPAAVVAPAVTDDFERVNTQFSTTVFSGKPAEWIAYLKQTPSRRYEPDLAVSIPWSERNHILAFRAESPEATALSRFLNQGFVRLRRRLAAKPLVEKVFSALVFGNQSNGHTDLDLRVSRSLPTDATREVRLDARLRAVSTTIVLRHGLVEEVLADLRDTGDSTDGEAAFGRGWMLIMRVLSQLGYSSYPRDRFVEKIQLTTDVNLIAVNALYDDAREGRLVPNAAGRAFEDWVARRQEVPVEELHVRDPYFRLLNELRFMVSESRYRGSEEVARVLVREYLDERYLRLSLSGVMPPAPPDRLSMPYEWKKKGIRRPGPEMGKYGIHDQDDLEAWRKVDGLFLDMGCPIIRQLGIGEFGRVYEAVNRDNPALPDHLAIKVDRIRKGEKKQAILAAEETVRIGRDLSVSPHVIRVYDAGKLPGKRYTYHLLQRVDGETLDHLAGIAGKEHASVQRPGSARGSRRDMTREVWDALKRSAGEAWRARRGSTAFTESLNLAQCLDLVTSIMLWVEEIHALGYAINDLKNGNLMINRRGQLKGIDLDAYSPLRRSTDRMPDFIFLAVSLLLLLLHLPDTPEGPGETVGEQLMNKPAALRRALTERWTFGDVGRLSHGRVESSQVIELFIDLISRSQNQTYLDHPAQFSADIDRLIFLKRSIFLQEIVLD